MLGRRRNGSVSTTRSAAATNPTNTPGSSQPNSPAGVPQRRKKGGLLSLLGCCGVPSHANTLDGSEQPLAPNKLDKIPERPLTAGTAGRRTATPSDQTVTAKPQAYEQDKDSQVQAGLSVQENSNSAKRTSQSTAPDQSGVSEQDSESKSTTLVASGPNITLDPPTDSKDIVVPQEEGLYSKAEDNDIEMPDADSAESQLPKPPVEDGYPKTIPPPPPPPSVPIVNEELDTVEDGEAVDAEQPQQKFLLPPIEPRFKGRKCLVLDLDETLVHSSFKVSSHIRMKFGLENSIVLDTTSSRFHDTC